jgi:putative PIG3 family NAD(P)H quinone oxidoreductase
MMRAITLHSPGGPEVLKLEEVEDPPPPKSGEILISARATAVNGADLLQRKGNYPPPPGVSPLLGLEVAGIVEKLGSSPGPWKIGDRVMALIAGGGYAEKVIAPQGSVMPMPEGFSFEKAAAIPEVFITAYLELKILGSLTRGQTALIHAGASGVGSAGIQIAKALGAIVIATAGSEKKTQACIEMGADHAIQYKLEPFDEAVGRLTKGAGVNCILDLVGAAHWEKNIRSLALDGRILLVGLGGGAKAEVDFRQLLQKRARIIASTLRSRTVEDKEVIVKDFVSFATPRFASGELKPVIDKIFSWKEAAASHAYLESQAAIGKVVLKID